MNSNMYAVDRSAVVLRPTEAFLHWLNDKEKDNEQALVLNLAQIRSNCTVLLLPEYDTPEEAIAYIDQHFTTLFQAELASWYPDSAEWPADMSLRTFWTFFEVEVHDMVIDLVEEDLNNSLLPHEHAD